MTECYANSGSQYTSIIFVSHKKGCTIQVLDLVRNVAMNTRAWEHSSPLGCAGGKRVHLLGGVWGKMDAEASRKTQWTRTAGSDLVRAW